MFLDGTHAQDRNKGSLQKGPSCWRNLESLKTLDSLHPLENGQILLYTLSQRATKGGLDPSWLDLAFLGRPNFQSRVLKYLF